jgi:hypothetical protein
VANLREKLTSLQVNQTRFDPRQLVNFSTDYTLRTYTSGCYFLDTTHNLWSGTPKFPLTLSSPLEAEKDLSNFNVFYPKIL